MTDDAAAAARAGVRVELLDRPGDLERLALLFATIWRPGDHQMPMPAELMRALGHAGNYIAGAYDGDRLVGGCVGFFGTPDERTLHSHIAGVAPDAQRRQIGYALKLHQRAWAAGHGAGQITWTFDPLVRRNAYFNMAKLGAVPTAYLPDFYGEMDDAINAGQGSDRLLVIWPVDATLGTLAVEPAGAELLLDEGADGAPVRPDSSSRTATTQALVRVPADIDDLRRTSPPAASAWRAAVREVLGAELDAGGQVTGFTRSGCYVLDRAPS